MEEGAPEQTHAAGAVKVHQLEDVHPAVGDVGQAQQEHKHAHHHGELEPARPEITRPVVHQPADERLHDAELRIEAQQQQHGEEQHAPEDRRVQLQDHLGEDQEGQSGAAANNVVHGDALGLSHEPQDGEDDDGRVEGGERVDAADHEGVPVAVLVELVVGTEGEQGADSDSVRVKDLGAAVDPTLRHGQSVPVRGEEVDDAVVGSIQAQGLHGQDRQNDVGKKCGEPNDLRF